MSLNAQPNVRRDSGRITPEMYIDMFKEAAITDMKKAGVPANITLAQGMYESDYEIVRWRRMPTIISE